MSNITIENPENLKTDSRISYVIRCIKESLTIQERQQGIDPGNITGFIRGVDFYKQLGGNSKHGKTGVSLDWADQRFFFPENKYMQGLQLYETDTGVYMGLISIFDVSGLHRSENSDCVPQCFCGGKNDSIIMAITSRHINREIRSHLALGRGTVWYFSEHTKSVSVGRISHLGDKWHSKGAGRRLFKAIDSFIQTFLIYREGHVGCIDEAITTSTTKTLSQSTYQYKNIYEMAITEFLQEIDTSKYINHEALIAEFLFNENFTNELMNKEGNAVDKLKKVYNLYVTSFTNFKNNLNRVVSHDLSTGVVTFYNKYPSEYSFFKNLDDFVQENPNIDEKIAGLNVGLQNDVDGKRRVVYYIPSVGLAQYELSNFDNALNNGAQEGRVHYFLDDVNGV